MNKHEYYLKNKEKIIERAKLRYRKNREEKLAYDKVRRQNPDIKKKRNESIALWRSKNPEKRKAHTMVSNAIRDGKFFRQP